MITRTLALSTLGLAIAASASALTYDQNVTPAVINGNGNANGFYTVDQQDGVELGLRVKLRFNAMNQPENTYNSNGDGTYSFAAGTPPVGFGFCPGCPTTPIWNFEWSVNTDFDGSSGLSVDDLTYRISLDADPGCTVDPLVFDPITPGAAQDCWDHSLGTNLTPGSGGAETNCALPGSMATYAANLAASNVAQNSWNYEFFNHFPPLTAFDPTLNGTYDISLTAFDAAGNVVASTTIQVIVGTGGGSDTDGDGVCDGDDACPGSSPSGTIVFGDCDTGVLNTVDATGCALSDALALCADDAHSHGEWVSCVAHLTNALKRDGVITGAQKGAIQSCAAHADIP